MNLHEYQGKSLLRQYGVPTPLGIVAYKHEDAIKSAEKIADMTGTDKWAIKAQIHAGGRGKGGGVKIAKSYDEVNQFAKEIIGMQLITAQTNIIGKKVNKVLIEENIFYKGENPVEEFYISIMLDREKKKNIIVYSPVGGMDIEAVAHDTPDKIFKEYIDPSIGIQDFQCRKIAFNFNLKAEALKSMISFVKNLYNAYINTDASLIEINPIIKTSDNKIIAADCKMSIDDNSLFKNPHIMEMRDIEEEDPTEVEAKEYGLNYVKLDGNVGCIVNGAGLAMATMDVIKLSGGDPANFLDVGGSADAKRVEKAFKIIMQDSNVKAILINIFGGIVRCDRVAQGIVDAYKNMKEISIPIIVRLQGTNSEEAKQIIDSSGLKVYSISSFDEVSSFINNVINK